MTTRLHPEHAWADRDAAGDLRVYARIDGIRYRFTANGMDDAPFPSQEEATRFCAYILDCEQHHKAGVNQTSWTPDAGTTPSVRYRAYLASVTQDHRDPAWEPFSTWLSGQWRRYAQVHRLPEKLPGMTELETARWQRHNLDHDAPFDVWLRARAGLDQ